MSTIFMHVLIKLTLISAVTRPQFTYEPSIEPSNEPTEQPSIYPSSPPSNQVNVPSLNPTIEPTLNPSKNAILSLTPFPKKAICNNLLSASIRIDNISLTQCIDSCQDLSFLECKMINYFNFWKTNDDSRCYIFDELCLLSMNLENSINSSQTWYKNQFSHKYCIDYRDYLDNLGDSCQQYTEYRWCNNSQVSDKLSMDQFEDLRSEWTATEACCNCGGGKLVVDGISIAYINNITDTLSECSFKNEQQNLKNIRKWNNFAAFDMTQYINEQLPESFNSDLLIFNEFESAHTSSVNSNSSMILCDFGSYAEGYLNMSYMTNDFFIMIVINYENKSHVLLNSEFYDINEHILSQSIEVVHYEYCLDEIQEYEQNGADINGIMPCWNQYIHPTLQPTQQPTQFPSIPFEDITKRKNEYFRWDSIIFISGVFIIFICIIIVACVCYSKKTKNKKADHDAGIVELEAQKYSADHFALHPMKKGQNTLPTTSASFLISSSNIINDEKEPMLMFDDEIKEPQRIEPGSEGYLNVFVDKKSNKPKKQCGKLVVQKQYYDAKQMRYLNYQFSKSVNGEFAYLLFGDNDLDRDRPKQTKRQHFGGQAGILGNYDRKFGYGIITTFQQKETPSLEKFKAIMNALFVPLQNHLCCGYNVVYTYPSKHELLKHRNRYYRNGKQIIYHNIGTGIAFFSLSIDHIEYIEFKLKELESFAAERIIVDYYYFNPTKNRKLTVYNPTYKIKEEKELEEKKEEKYYYFCPSCGLEKHYLMKFENCNHRMCEECLRGYIVYDMQYNQDTDRERFRCYAYILNKCNGYLCMNDINYPVDRCNCDECLKNNTDSGNGTILCDDNYNKLKNIMLSFDVKLEFWNKDICPNMKCRKPFVIQKPFELIENRESEQSIQVLINENRKELDHCNCCGKIRRFSGIIGELEEEKDNDNICVVCNYYNCDECRANCFYKVDTNFTQQPASQILNAFIRHNLKRVEHECKMHVSFEICEICWYNYYCHICPHCGYIFCGECDIDWKGNTINWLDRNDLNINGVNIIKKNHNIASKHKCMKQKEKLQKQQMHKNYIRINKHAEKLNKMNLENQKKDEFIFVKEAENFKLKQKIKQMEHKMTELKIENQEKENMVLLKTLSITTKQKNEVEEKLNNIKYTNIWQWLDDKNKWKICKKEQMDTLEQLQVGQTYKFALNGQNYVVYKLSIDRAEQVNSKTNKKRNIRRIKIEKQINDIMYPEFWQYYASNMNELDENKEGIYVSPGGNNVDIDDNYTTAKLVELDLKNNSLAQKVCKEFYLTAAKSNKIVRIESVQNRYLWDKYYTQKESMKKSIGLNKLNEKSLWHGTHIDIIAKITKQGFRKEFNSTHKYGEGTYFAQNAKYSVRYCTSNNKTYQMFQVLVLCGESVLGSKNITLRNWPIKKNGCGQIYDSLVNNIKKPSIYVIHDDVRVYPMFIVHFTKS